MGNVDIRLRRLVHLAVTHIADDPDDFGALVEPPLPNTYVLAEGVIAWPEATRGHIADKDDLQRTFTIRVPEQTSPKQRNPHRAKVVRRNKMYADGWLRSRRHRRTVAKPDDRAVATSGERVAVAQPNRVDTWERCHLILQLVEERSSSHAAETGCIRTHDYFGVRRGQVDSHRKDILRVDAARRGDQPSEALNHKPGTG